jgi:phage portal protein BeeE
VNLLEAIRSRSSADRDIATLDDYASLVSQQLVYAGNQYSGQIIEGIYENRPAEQIATSLESYTRAAFGQSGVLFSVIAVRALVFSGVRFLWQRLKAGKTGDLFFTADLGVLSQPWPGGTTQDLLMKMELDATLAGNSYWLRYGKELVRLRPDWVQIILGPRIINGHQVGVEKLGYAYWEGGPQKGQDPALFRATEVAHYAPMPDPLATYRGMSWITPIIPQIIGDKEMTRHKNAFFANAATPQLSVSMDKAVSRAQFEAFIDKFEGKYRGAENAYKTMFLGGGADVKIIGTNFQQMDFSNVQGKAETLISAAGGVPPIIVGLSEGLASATYSNYSQARRRFADGTLHPLWANAAGSMGQLFSRPKDLPGTSARLWYDASENPFLLEDRDAAAEIQGRQAATIRQLVDAGYKPETVVAAVMNEDFSLLQHSGLYSVQLQPPGTVAKATTQSGNAIKGTPAQAPLSGAKIVKPNPKPAAQPGPKREDDAPVFDFPVATIDAGGLSSD